MTKNMILADVVFDGRVPVTARLQRSKIDTAAYARSLMARMQAEHEEVMRDIAAVDSYESWTAFARKWGRQA